MTEPDTITPQEPGAELAPMTPGENPAVDSAKLDAILAGKPKDIIGELDDLSPDELTQLRALEMARKSPRAPVLKAIDVLAGQRAADAALQTVEVQGNSNANLGDRERYARMHASEVDASKLLVPVLTLDGWVLPPPRAEG